MDAERALSRRFCDLRGRLPRPLPYGDFLHRRL